MSDFGNDESKFFQNFRDCSIWGILTEYLIGGYWTSTPESMEAFGVANFVWHHRKSDISASNRRIIFLWILHWIEQIKTEKIMGVGFSSSVRRPRSNLRKLNIRFFDITTVFKCYSSVLKDGKLLKMVDICMHFQNIYNLLYPMFNSVEMEASGSQKLLTWWQFSKKL
jgi:hypothetical protein